MVAMPAPVALLFVLACCYSAAASPSGSCSHANPAVASSNGSCAQEEVDSTEFLQNLARVKFAKDFQKGPGDDDSLLYKCEGSSATELGAVSCDGMCVAPLADGIEAFPLLGTMRKKAREGMCQAATITSSGAATCNRQIQYQNTGSICDLLDMVFHIPSDMCKVVIGCFKDGINGDMESCLSRQQDMVMNRIKSVLKNIASVAEVTHEMFDPNAVIKNVKCPLTEPPVWDKIYQALKRIFQMLEKAEEAFSKSMVDVLKEDVGTCKWSFLVGLGVSFDFGPISKGEEIGIYVTLPLPKIKELSNMGVAGRKHSLHNWIFDYLLDLHNQDVQVGVYSASSVSLQVNAELEFEAGVAISVFAGDQSNWGGYGFDLTFSIGLPPPLGIEFDLSLVFSARSDKQVNRLIGFSYYMSFEVGLEASPISASIGCGLATTWQVDFKIWSCIPGVTSGNNVIKCQDGEECSGWSCCADKGMKRIQCPPYLPILCNKDNSCGGGRDRCCNSRADNCADEDGPAPCELQNLGMRRFDLMKTIPGGINLDPSDLGSSRLPTISASDTCAQTQEYFGKSVRNAKQEMGLLTRLQGSAEHLMKEAYDCAKAVHCMRSECMNEIIGYGNAAKQVVRKCSDDYSYNEQCHSFVRKCIDQDNAPKTPPCMKCVRKEERCAQCVDVKPNTCKKCVVKQSKGECVKCVKKQSRCVRCKVNHCQKYTDPCKRMRNACRYAGCAWWDFRCRMICQETEKQGGLCVLGVKTPDRCMAWTSEVEEDPDCHGEQRRCERRENFENIVNNLACEGPNYVCKKTRDIIHTVSDTVCRGAHQVCTLRETLKVVVNDAICEGGRLVCQKKHEITEEVSDALCKGTNRVCKLRDQVSNCIGHFVDDAQRCSRWAATSTHRCTGRIIEEFVHNDNGNFGRCIRGVDKCTELVPDFLKQ